MEALQNSLEQSLKAAKWLTEADAAAVELARVLIDKMGKVEPREMTTIGRLLNDVLKDLGLSVAGRGGKPEIEAEENKLDEIKQAAAGRVGKTQTGNKAKQTPVSN